MKVWFIAALFVGTGITDFHGPSRLAASIKDAKTEILVYSNNGNDIGLLTKGTVLPLSLDTRLSVPGGCCLHPATPSLSPDGRRIAYVHLASEKPRQETINIYDHDAEEQKSVFQAEMIWSVSWAPDGEHLAVIADRAAEQAHNLYLVDLKSNVASELTHGAFDLDDKKYIVSNHAPASWSRAGNRLAVEVRNASALAENSTSGAIAVWNLETNEVHRLTDGVDPSWSPAEDVIAFFEPSREKCFTIKAGGSDRKMLFALGEKGFASRSTLLSFPVVWSPDGRELIFHQWVDADLVTDVYRLDLAKGKPKFLARSEVQVVSWRQTR